jgi:hypothetical protein
MTNEKKFNWLTETLLIAAFPTLIYFLAYLKEVGYCTYFQIPSSFIQVDFSVTLRIGVIICFFLLVAFIATGLSNYLLKDIDSHKKAVTAFLSCLIPFACGFIVSSTFPLTTQLMWVIGFIAMIAIIFLTTQKVFEFLKSPTFPLIISTFLGVTIFFGLFGFFEAKDTKQFLVPNTFPNNVVLRIYDKNLICAEYDKSSNKVFQKFKIIELGKDENLVLSMEKIGFLTPENSKNK